MDPPTRLRLGSGGNCGGIANRVPTGYRWGSHVTWRHVVSPAFSDRLYALRKDEDLKRLKVARDSWGTKRLFL